MSPPAKAKNGAEKFSYADYLTWPDEERRLTGVETISSLEDAIRESIARAGDAAVAVIPEGPYVVPTAA